MVHFRTQRQPPHLVIELQGEVSGNSVRRELTDLPSALSALPPNFVVMALYPHLTRVGDDAAGPLFYFVAHLFDADPGFCAFVDGAESPHPGLRSFIQRVAREDQVVFVPTEAEAQRRIRAYLGSQPTDR
jgi:hypothetical protein